MPVQRLKVTDDMRLLEVAGLVCERYPVDVVRGSDAIDDRGGVAGVVVDGLRMSPQQGFDDGDALRITAGAARHL